MGEAQPQTAVLQFLGDPATHGNHRGSAHRYPRQRGLSRWRPRPEGQARGAFAVSRLFDLGEAQGRVRVGAGGQPRLCARALSRASCRSPGIQAARLALDGDGETIEWAVEMLRFDESQTLDRIADVRGIDDALARKLAETIVAMHARVPVVDANSWIAALDRFLEQNAAAFREAPALFPADLAAKLDHAARAALERLRPLLASRGRRGLIRQRSRRSSPWQHCPAGRASSAVRCDRIRPGRRCGRCPVRSGVSADGFAGARSRSCCEYRVQRLFRSD